MIARRFVVKGRVQGVGFRWFVSRAARRLGLTGWTRNAPDGSVEVLAQGDAEEVTALGSELAVGPRSARVTEVDAEEAVPDPGLIDFEVRY